MYLATQTTMRWNQSSVLRIAGVYRGGAVPVVWKVLAEEDTAAAFDVYQILLLRTNRLLPNGVKVVPLQQALNPLHHS